MTNASSTMKCNTWEAERRNVIPRIGLDFSVLDQLTIGGQYRYVVNLVKGLSELSQAHAQFILFGSKPEPVAELMAVFQTRGNRWSYRQIRPWKFRGNYYLNQLRYAAIIYSNQVHLWHVLHSPIPIAAPCRIVLTIYDMMYELFDEYKEIIHSKLYRIEKWGARRRADHIIAISQTTADDIENRWTIPHNKISTIHLGTDFSNIAIPYTNGEITRLVKGYSGATILSPFNLEPRKNLESLLLAMPSLCARHPNLRLILFGLAGWSPEREKNFKELIHKLEIEDRIICTGFVSNIDLMTLYRYSTIFVFPSLYEGFGFPILEAMQVGACVVARKISSMAEIVGEAGVLVESCDPYELASTILKLLDDEMERKRLGEAARLRAKEFSIQKMALKTWQVYEQVLHRTEH